MHALNLHQVKSIHVEQDNLITEEGDPFSVKHIIIETASGSIDIALFSNDPDTLEFVVDKT